MFFQQKVSKDVYSQNTVVVTNNANNVTNLSNEPQFENIPSIQGNGRLNNSIKPIEKGLEEEEEKNTISVSSKIKIFNYASWFHSQIFTKYSSFPFYENLGTYTRLFSRICCWRI